MFETINKQLNFLKSLFDTSHSNHKEEIYEIGLLDGRRLPPILALRAASQLLQCFSAIGEHAPIGDDYFNVMRSLERDRT